MKVHDLKPAAGSTRPRRRVGRGIAGKGGKTAGRGTKGQGARDNIKPGFEGGQLPLKQRIPKLKGFKNPFRVEYNVDQPRHPGRLRRATWSPPTPSGPPAWCTSTAWSRCSGRGELTRRVDVVGPRLLRSRAVGGHRGRRADASTVLPPPFGHGRPPAKGNALTNR